MDETHKYNDLISFWRIRAVMLTLLAVFALWIYFNHSGEKRIEFWHVPFTICWAISCWPQVLDKKFGVYCTLSRAEQKLLPKSPSYWITNLFGTATIALIVGLLLESLWVHSR